jgi:hypothetical protein
MAICTCESVIAAREENGWDHGSLTGKTSPSAASGPPKKGERKQLQHWPS